MVDYLDRAVAMIDGVTRDEFDHNEQLQLALTHLLQVIGEAGTRVSQELRTENPDVPWGEIIGMRNKIVHDYMGIDEDVVWTTATQDLAPLRERLHDLTSRLRD